MSVCANPNSLLVYVSLIINPRPLNMQRCCELNETVADLEDQLTQASLQSASAAHSAAGKAAAAATLSNDLVADSEYHKQIAQLEVRGGG